MLACFGGEQSPWAAERTTPATTTPAPTISGAAAGATTKTITTEYSYNADGALTSITTQVDQEDPATVYLTWGNFTPQPGDATAGTVTQANGNLIGYGPTPGGAYTTAFGFDRRNRLTAYTGDGTSVTYAYHPTSTLAASTLASGDSLRFYYGAGALPRMANIRQTSSGLSSGRMGPVRYLSDNRQQLLLQPRKDVAGAYDLSGNTLSAYQYDPYGGTSLAPEQGGGAAATSYDLAANPFRYAGEFQDPTWQGVYLRARWYAPEMQTFLSRDPRQNLNRFGYTDGNPVSRVDPTGERYDTFANWVSGHIVRPLERGPLGWALTKEFLTGPFLGVVGIFALPSSWWHNPANSAELGTFLITGIVAEGLGSLWAVDTRFGFAGAQWLRHGTDVVLGLAQTFLGSVDWKNGHLNGRNVAAGIAITIGSIVESRTLFGIGYRPYNLNTDDIIALARNPALADDEMLVFRVKRPLGGGRVGRLFDNASWIGEKTATSLYHESILILGRGIADPAQEALVHTENLGYRYDRSAVGRNKFDDLLTDDDANKRRFQLVGKFALSRAWESNLLSLMTRDEWDSMSGWQRLKYRFGRGMPLINNCHWYANALVSSLGQPLP